MSLAAGSQLGPYQILSPLGAGGMGEVYRARDSRVGRDVAIKVAADQFTERFHREATAIAALNHANICHLYDVGPNYLVMELVDGEAPRGPLAFADALPILRQLIDGLEAAHEKGIVHRDLKPANIKVTPDGVVKILDFGLARALAPEDGSGPAVDAARSPTMTIDATRVGTILGTAAYMAPEQARGKTADRRADIWAFGAVAYELLAGTPPFAGESVAEILGAVLHTEPDWSRLPAPARPLVQWCLKKDRKERLQAIGDARILLASAPATPVATAAHTRQVPWWATAALALAALSLAWPAYLHWREVAPPAPAEVRTEVPTPQTAEPVSFALSPDGQSIAFVASQNGRSQLWVRPLRETRAEPLAGTEGARLPFWSPDGRALGFFAGGKLLRVDVDGRNPHTLADGVQARGGTWHANGTIVYAPAASGPLFRLPASGGQPEALTTLEDGQIRHSFPEFLPDSDRFVFLATTDTGTRALYLASLSQPSATRLGTADSHAAFLASGHLLFLRQGNLVAQPFDPVTGRLGAEVVQIGGPVDQRQVRGGFAVSRTGVIAYRGPNVARRQLTWFDRTGRIRGTIGPLVTNRDSGAPKVSPDGRFVVASRPDGRGALDLWLMEGDRETRLTFDAAHENAALWSPNGKRLAFYSSRSGGQDLYWKPSDSTGRDELLLASPQADVPNDWSRDGRFLLFHRFDENRDLWLLPIDGDRPGPPRPYLQTPANERVGRFSPDGRWVAYEADPDSVYNVYVRPFPDADAGQWQISTDGGSQPRWSHDGRELFYLTDAGTLMAVSVRTEGRTLIHGRPAELFDARTGPRPEAGGGFSYDVAPDGRFLVDAVVEEGTSPITLIQNWKPPVK